MNSQPIPFAPKGAIAAPSQYIELEYRPEGDTRRLREFLAMNQSALVALTIASPIVLTIIGSCILTTMSWVHYAPQLSWDSIMSIVSIVIAAICPLTFFLAYRLGKTVWQPTNLCLDSRSVWIQSRQVSLAKRKLFDWHELTHIGVVSIAGRTKKEDQYIEFSTSSHKMQKLKLAGFVGSVGQSKLMECIRTYAREVPRSPELMLLLEPPPDHSYTELWLTALSAPPQLSLLTPLVPGRQLKNGKYTVIGKLGGGGQGSAYLANNNDTQATEFTVVLKEYVLPVQVTRASKRQSLETLENEARILEKLSHQQIVCLLDYFVEDHRGYLVLEHISGVSLRQYVIEHGPLSEPIVREIGLQLCYILSYLHRQTPPVVHRDFTPDNSMLNDENVVKLIDFNVAQQIAETVTATVVGKHSYLPPEQFRGKATTASDIYAFGGTIHFLLTGQEPEPLSVSHPQEINAAVSDHLDALVAASTQLNASARPSAEELVKALRDQ